MTPAEQAAAVYHREECPRSFRQDLEAHLVNPRAVVIATGRLFCMARPVSRDWDQLAITDPNFNSLTCAPDCWHVYLGAGDISEFFTFPHDFLPWVSFERGNRLRIHRYDTLRRRCTTNSKALTSTPTSFGLDGFSDSTRARNRLRS